MTVIGSSEEINKVLQGIKPDFPRQNFESIESRECFYWINGVKVYIELKQAPD